MRRQKQSVKMKKAAKPAKVARGVKSLKKPSEGKVIEKAVRDFYRRHGAEMSRLAYA
jgi:hypothetical protein